MFLDLITAQNYPGFLTSFDSWYFYLTRIQLLNAIFEKESVR